MSNHVNRLRGIIAHLEEPGTSEAQAVADLLQDLLDNDDPTMITPDCIVAVLDELIAWANHAKTLAMHSTKTRGS